MDCACRALVHALATQLTLVEIDISEVVVECNGLERTGFGALAATDAGSRTVFASDGTLVATHAGHEYATVFGTFVAEFEECFRALTDACAASSTFILVDDGQTGFGVH